MGSDILFQAANWRASCDPLTRKKNVLWCLEQEAESCLSHFSVDWSCWVRWFTSRILATQEAEAGGWQAKGQDRQLSETLL